MNLLEFVTDPSSQQGSTSRLGMLLMVVMMVVIDIVGIYLMLHGKFMKEWFGPLAIMNSSTVGSLALVYYGNSKAGAGGKWKAEVSMEEYGKKSESEDTPLLRSKHLSDIK